MVPECEAENIAIAATKTAMRKLPKNFILLAELFEKGDSKFLFRNNFRLFAVRAFGSVSPDALN